MARRGSMEAALRRMEREAQKKQRELERRAKELAKLSMLEQASLEVDTFNNKLEVLLTFHKEQSEVWDWVGLYTSLPPPPPVRHSYFELQALQNAQVLHPLRQADSVSDIARAKERDEQAFTDRTEAYRSEQAEWEMLRRLSARVLSGELKAYSEALVTYNPFTEIDGLGSQLRFKVHDAKTLTCTLKVHGTDIIPSESKTLTATGKISVKPMPRIRFHELYQDHLCSCILRVARESFALLPIEQFLITAHVKMLDSGTGHSTEQPVISALITRDLLHRLDFERIDPSDALETFVHRGDFKASRKSGAFGVITPLTPADLGEPGERPRELGEYAARLERLRESLSSELKEIREKVRKHSEERVTA